MNRLQKIALRIAQEPEDAAGAYKVRMKGLRKQIADFLTKLKKHEQKAKRDSTNWAYAGDLAHYSEVIYDLNRNMNV